MVSAVVSPVAGVTLAVEIVGNPREPGGPENMNHINVEVISPPRKQCFSINRAQIRPTSQRTQQPPPNSTTTPSHNHSFIKQTRSPTITDQPGGLGAGAEVSDVEVLGALPEEGVLLAAGVEPLRPPAVPQRGLELRVLPGRGPAAQHGAHHGRRLSVPAGVTHRPPGPVEVDLHRTGAAVCAAAETDRSHLWGGGGRIQMSSSHPGLI